MTSLLQKAFEKASALNSDAQNLLAKQLLDDIESETRWDKTLQLSPDKLAKLADKAVDDYNAGRGKQAGFDEL